MLFKYGNMNYTIVCLKQLLHMISFMHLLFLMYDMHYALAVPHV